MYIYAYEQIPVRLHLLDFIYQQDRLGSYRDSSLHLEARSTVEWNIIS